MIPQDLRLHQKPILVSLFAAGIRAAALVLLACAAPALAQRSTPLQLLAPDGASNDRFGSSVAVEGDIMVIGSSADDVGPIIDQGAAHVYRWTGTSWTHETTLTASDGAASDSFGNWCAISGDTILIGAVGDDNGANVDQGCAYVFVRSGNSWTQQAKLVAADGAAGDIFGQVADISGNTVVVSSNFDDIGANSNQGSIYVFTRRGTMWTQQAKIQAFDGGPSHEFGRSVSIDGDTMVAGSIYATGSSGAQGAAYVFTRTQTAWSLQAKLTASDGVSGDFFGFSTDIVGDTLAVGAYRHNSWRGAVYLFTRAGTAWTQRAKVTASDGVANDLFGNGVSLSGDTLAVEGWGANAETGSAYIFTGSGASWTQQAKLTAPDRVAGDRFGTGIAVSGDIVVAGVHKDDIGASVDQGSAWVFSRVGSTWIAPELKILAADGVAGDNFGYSVAIDGDTAVIGAQTDDTWGSVYVLVRSGAAWTQQAKLTASDRAANDAFGYSVAIEGDTIVVSATGDDVGANVNQGSTYVFTRSGTTWTQQAKITASDGVANDYFGTQVRLSGNTAIVGAHVDDSSRGSAYVFVRSGVSWSQQAKLIASDGAASDYFGWAVAVSGDTALVGAYNDGEGSAYIFTRSGATWTQQAKLTASDRAAGDRFGFSVAVIGDVALIGAKEDDALRGSAYAFSRSGMIWAQQAKLIASDGVAGDQFGHSVAMDGDMAIIGAVGGDSAHGAAYVFVHSENTWTQQDRLTASDGTTSDYFGYTVAVSDDTWIVGSHQDDSARGSAHILYAPRASFSIAHNDTLDLSYPSLAAAVLVAQSGHQITATPGAFAEIGFLDTLGRSLGLYSSGPARTPSTSTLTLGGASYLAAAAGEPVEIFGNLRISANSSADVVADHFLLGSRGIMTARTGSSLTINSAAAELMGQTRFEQNTSMTFGGSVENIGPVTGAINASITAGGTMSNCDTWSLTAAQLFTPLYWNRASTNIFGSTAIFGNFTNEVGAITTIRSGTLFVFGSLTNNGTIVGDLCAMCSGTPPGFDVTGDLALGNAASLLMLPGALVHVGGNFDCAINSNTRFNMAEATLQMEGMGPEQTLEVMSIDLGVDPSGLDRTFAGHYPLGTLKIGPSPSTIRLVDNHDNDGLGQGTPEGIYIDQLVIETGGRLDNTQGIIYFNTLINNGTIEVPENVIPLIPPCPADFNQDGGVDGSDINAFFEAWEAGEPTADVNLDGGVDGGDVEVFFVAWEAGGCE